MRSSQTPETLRETPVIAAVADLAPAHPAGAWALQQVARLRAAAILALALPLLVLLPYPFAGAPVADLLGSPPLELM